MSKRESSTNAHSAAKTPRFTLRFSLRSHLSEVPAASKRIADFVTGHGASPHDAMDIRIAIAEACNNAVQYAQSDTQIEIKACLEDGTFTSTVIDHTAGFTLPQEASLPDDLAERGRGLFLIQNIMDTIEYHRGPSGNRLIMSRRITPA